MQSKLQTKTEPVLLDGSFGEGGGQILRTALGLSLATGRPFVIEKIRANREKPGLLRQHLTAVLAAAEVGSAEVSGAELGSQRLSFWPGQVKGGEYTFKIGTAGSTTLVLQTILPALMTAREPSTISLEGGTHNPLAPPFEFLDRAFAPVISRLGPQIELRLLRHGFYPAGGGRLEAEIKPVPELSALHIGARRTVTTSRAVARVVNLPHHIAARELEVLKQSLAWPQERIGIEHSGDSASPGNLVLIEIGDDQVTEVITALGRRGVAAEEVANEAAREAKAFLASDAAVGEHLCDQLLLPMALAGEGSFTASVISSHTVTNIATIQKFLDVSIEIEETASYHSVRIRRS